MKFKPSLALLVGLSMPFLQARGYDDHDKMRDDSDILEAAVVKNDIGAINRVLDVSPDRQELLERGVCFAAECGDLHLIHFFLSAGACVNGQYGGWSALHYAVKKGSNECVNMLLDAGADIDSRTYWCQVTPLFIAVEYKNIKMVKLLVARGASLQVKSYWLKDTITHATVNARDGKILEYLLSINAPLNTRNNSDRTPVVHAAILEKIDLLKIILAYKPEFTWADQNKIEAHWKHGNENYRRTDRRSKIISLLDHSRNA
jgi:ankyrin repeat protein